MNVRWKAYATTFNDRPAVIVHVDTPHTQVDINSMYSNALDVQICMYVNNLPTSVGFLYYAVVIIMGRDATARELAERINSDGRRRY